MTHSLLRDPALLSIAEDVARNMARSSDTLEGVVISTPILYPSGAPVVVRLDGARDNFFVTDLGLGYQESMMVSASHLFASVAKKIIYGSGVSFDSRSFFVGQASRLDLVEVVGAVANFSQRAVIETLSKHEAKKVDKDRIELIARLEGIFGRLKVERDYEIRGASAIEWPVIARVHSDNVVSIFDYVRPHSNSVVHAVAKFHDIARLPDPPRRFVSVSDKEQMRHYLGLLSQAANVVSIAEMPDAAVKKLVA